MNNTFTLWQLPSQSPSQMESYVIKSVNGKIIVIDGGMTCDGPYLKKFIEDLGNCVDMWILIHAHCDHIDAMAWILSNQGNLEIKDIYASFSPLDWVQKYENHEALSLENFEIVIKKVGRNYIKTNTGDKLLKNIDHNKLKVDYVQMAHHGQNGVRKNFYKIIRPKYCLWSTPVWLWNNDSGKGENSGPWRTLEVRDWMKELNVEKNYVSGLSNEPLLIH
jgi:beta-lactamase superfamily II metal-dependent hydrolase